MYFVKEIFGKRARCPIPKCTLVFLLLIHDFQASTGLLYIVRQTCTRGTVFTPAPATTNSICLQCVCVMANISYCKTLIVQLSVVCSAALVAPVVAVTTAAPTTTTTRPLVVLTIPTIAPTVLATTSIGINPRASSPAASAMMVPTSPALMVGSPMMMMMMTAAGTAAGMSMTAAGGVTSMTPMPAG